MSLAASVMRYGWGQLKDSLKPLWILNFLIFKVNLYPRLYPHFCTASQAITERPDGTDHWPQNNIVFTAMWCAGHLLSANLPVQTHHTQTRVR